MGACGIPGPGRRLAASGALLGACLFVGAVLSLSVPGVTVPVAQASADTEEPAGTAELRPPPALSLPVGGEAEASVEVEAGQHESTCLHAEEVAGLGFIFDPACGDGDYTATVTARATGAAEPGARTVTLVATGGDGVVASADWSVTVLETRPPVEEPPVGEPPSEEPPAEEQPPPPAEEPSPPAAEEQPPPPAEESPQPPAATPGPAPDPGPGDPPTDDPPGFAGHLVSNPPAQMRLGEEEIVEVRISRDLSIDLAEDLLGEGVPEEEELNVAALMSAKLIGGDNFRVTALKKEEQFVREDGFTEWAWRVEPVRAGDHTLYLTLSAYVSQDGGVSRDYPLRDWTIRVYRNPVHSTRTFLGSNWQYLLTTMVGSGLLGMFVGRRGKGR